MTNARKDVLILRQVILLDTANSSNIPELTLKFEMVLLTDSNRAAEKYLNTMKY
jgi:hypothetical protein